MTGRDPRAVARDAADRTLSTLEADVAGVVGHALGEVARRFAELLEDPTLPMPAPPTPPALAAAGDALDPGRLAALATLWAQQLDTILDAVKSVYERAWTATARRFTPGSPPPTVPATVDAYLRTARNRLTLVGDSLWDKARNTLADGVAAGETIDQLRARLQDTFARDGAELGAVRATRIARTEVVSAWNASSLASVRNLPAGQRPGYKTWLATIDHRTREAHWLADGQVVPIDAPFTVGGELLDHPGDPAGTPSNVVNCRCTPTYSTTPTPMPDEGRQYLTAREIAELDAERPGRGQGTAPPEPLAASNLTTADLGAAGCRAGPTEPNHREREMPTQLDTVIATVNAGGHWTAEDVAATEGVTVGLPTVRTYLARAVELGRLQRLGRGVYAAATTEVTWSTPAPAALWFEDQETGDGRIFGREALFWETGEGGWPLQYADEMLGGHDGAELAGPIRTVTREGGRGAGTGALYADVAAGATALSLLERGAPLGVSVDLDDVSFEVVDRRPPEDGDDPVALAASAGAMTVTPLGDGRYRVRATGLGDIVASCDCAGTATTLAELMAAVGITDDAGLTGITAAAGDADTDDGDVVVAENSGDLLFRITRARFRGATLVTMPAFSNARIVLDAPAVAAAGDVTAAVEGNVDLPVHEDRERRWDGDAATGRVFEWATDTDGNVDPSRVAQAFLWRRPDVDPTTQEAWALGFADVVDGDLQILAEGVFACAGGHGVDAVEGLGDDDRQQVRSRICTLYGRLADAYDDDDLTCPFDQTASAAAGPVHEGTVNDDRTAAYAAVAAAAGHTGAMLALVPADPEALAIAGDGATSPAELHVTLAYLGQAADLTDDAIQAARDAAAGAAYYHAPVVAVVAGVGQLGQDDPPATVLLLNGSEMAAVHDSACAGLEDHGWEAFHEQHEPWIPHMTLGYGLEPGSVPAYEPIRFDRIRLALGGTVMDWPLSGPDNADAGDVDPTDDSEGDELTEVEASAWHELGQLPPLPAGWFAEPTEAELPADGGPVHYADGRIWGWVAQRGVPHESLGIEAPIDGCDLTTFLRSSRTLDDGSEVRVGAFTMNVGHHRDSAECETEQCAFDNTRTVAGIVTVGTNARGMWFAGAAAPWLSEWDAAVFAACAPSGHWRQDRRGRWSLRAVLAVPFPGYPTRLAAAAVVHRSNLAVAAAAAPAPAVAETATATTTVTVTEVLEAELGDLEWGTFAAAVVDEIERRQAARAEIAALTAEIDAGADGVTTAVPGGD